MRTTVDIPDELFRRAKSQAALQGRKLKDLVEAGLRLVVDGAGNEGKAPDRRQPVKRPTPGSLHERMQDLCGIIEDGPPDLSTNSKYFDEFGR